MTGPVTGRLTVLIGTSSVGKTSVARELQLLLGEPHLVVGVDDFFAMFPQQWAGQPRGPGPGFWYDDRTDPDGGPRARIPYGEVGGRLLAGMRAAVCALLDAGLDVILDEMPVDETILPAWRSALDGYQSYWVLLTAPLAVVEERERGRTRGRHLGNARGHYALTETAEVDLRLDTTSLTPHEAARAIQGHRPF